MKISFELNGRPATADVPPMKRLLDVLREDLRLTGTKEGCGEGECGACNVLLDGDLVTSCLVPAVQADGCTVQTVEGLAKGDALAPLQKAFLQCNGAQCGICTPGMLLAGQFYLDAEARLPDEDAREALAGNLCRCTGYESILQAMDLVMAHKPVARKPAAKKVTAKKKSTKKATQKTPAAAKRASKKAPTKATKKPAKPTAKKAPAKATKKRAKPTAKKAPAKAAKKPAKPTAKKAPAKAAKKPTKPTAKKAPAKAAARRATKKPATKKPATKKGTRR